MTPLYTFDCGEHREDQVARVGQAFSVCSCGQESKRVFDLKASQVKGKWASEFELSRTMRDLRDEASHWKNIALKEKHEAEMNGFRVQQEK